MKPLLPFVGSEFGDRNSNLRISIKDDLLSNQGMRPAGETLFLRAHGIQESEERLSPLPLPGVRPSVLPCAQVLRRLP